MGGILSNLLYMASNGGWRHRCGTLLQFSKSCREGGARGWESGSLLHSGTRGQNNTNIKETSLRNIIIIIIIIIIISNIAIRCTYYIFCCKNKEWNKPELLNFWTIFIFLNVLKQLVVRCKLPNFSEVYTCILLNDDDMKFQNYYSRIFIQDITSVVRCIFTYLHCFPNSPLWVEGVTGCPDTPPPTLVLES